MTLSTFSCYQCDDDDCKVPEGQLSFCKNAINCWKSSLREKDGSFRYARGCIAKLDQVRLVCSSMQANNSRYRIECCTKEYCNGGVFPVLNASDNHPYAGNRTAKKILVIVLVLLSITIFMLVIYWLQKYAVSTNSIWQQERRRGYRVRSTYAASNSISENKITLAIDSTVKENLPSKSLTSGSGLGRSTQRDLSKQITLVENLSNGNFGPQHPKLWRGIWQDKNVMVKIFSSRSESIWAYETEVYTKLLPPKHANLLTYVGSDTTSATNDMQFWLITRYQMNGSLVNYLRGVSLNQNAMLKACLSLTNGLLYLHSETNGTKGKLPMAHRNLCSTNIFVNNDGVCMIGGFEYVATQDRLGDTNFLALASKRYMSPELLEPTFEHGIWSLEGFQQADVYSMSLILWEICRMRVNTNDDVLTYIAPFSEWLNDDEPEPAIDSMRLVICVNQRRPQIPDQWQDDPIMNALGSMIEECWVTKASARWPILRVKKTLLKLENN